MAWAKVQTEEIKSGNGSNVNFDFSFPYITTDDVKVEHPIDTPVTNWSINTSNPGRVVFNTAPANGTDNIRIYRDTAVNTAKAVYAAGSSVRAKDLNDNQDQVLYHAQEEQNNLITTGRVRNKQITNDKIADNTIVDAKINTAAEINVTKLGHSSTNKEVIQTNGSDVEWTSNIDLPGTLGAAGVTTLKNEVNIQTGNKVNFKKADGTVTTDINCNTGVIRVGTGLSEQSGDAAIFNGKVIVYGDNLEVADGDNITSGDTKKVRVQTTSGTDKATITGATGNIWTAGEVNAATLAGNAIVTSGDATSSDDKVYSAKRSDERYYNIGTSEEIVSGETWSGNDTSVATTKAIDNRIVDLMDDVGGFLPLLDEGGIPTAHPEAANVTTADRVGTIISIGVIAKSGGYTPSGGTCTIPASELDNHSVDATITDCGTTVLAEGFGVLVETKAQTDAQYASGPSFKFHRLTPKATEVTNVAGKAAEITRLGTAAAVEDMSHLGTADCVSDMDTLGTAQNVTNMNTLAGIQANITTVAGISSNVTSVAGNATNINNVAGKTTEIGLLGTSDAVADMALLGTADCVADMNLLGTTDCVADMAILGTTDVVSDLNTLATTDIVSDLDTCATNIANINHVGGGITNVNSVATNIAGVHHYADVYQVATSQPSERADGDPLIAGDMWFDSSSNKELKIHNGSAYQLVTPSQSVLNDISVVSGNITYEEDLGLIVENVATGTGNSIETVADNITKVTTVHTNIANVNTVGAAIANVNTVATNVANVNTVGGAIGNVNRYADEYVIQSGNPSSPSAGDLWYNTGSNTLNYYNGSNWIGISPGISSVISDTNPGLGGHLDCNDKNLTEVGTISGNNLQVDFGTL